MNIEELFAAMRMAAQTLEWEGRDGLGPFARHISEALSRYFQTSHASLWLLDGAPGAYRLRCLGSHESDGPSQQKPVCDQQVYPGYFSSLLTQGVFRCEDSLTDERLRALAPPPAWRAMLDMGGQINGRTVGVLALGQRNEPRVWTKREELDLRRATAKTCLKLHSLRHELETV